MDTEGLHENHLYAQSWEKLPRQLIPLRTPSMKSFMKVINSQRRICFKEWNAQESCRKWSFSLGSVTLYFTCEYQVYNNCPARPKIPDGQKLHFVHLRISASLDTVPACGDCSADTRRALLRLKKKFSLEPRAKSAGY